MRSFRVMALDQGQAKENKRKWRVTLQVEVLLDVSGSCNLHILYKESISSTSQYWLLLDLMNHRTQDLELTNFKMAATANLPSKTQKGLWICQIDKYWSKIWGWIPTHVLSAYRPHGSFVDIFVANYLDSTLLAKKLHEPLRKLY